MKLKRVCLMLAIASGVHGFSLSGSTKDWSAKNAGGVGASVGAFGGAVYSVSDYLSLKSRERVLEAQIAGDEPSDKSFEELKKELKLVRLQKSRFFRYVKPILIGAFLGGGIGVAGQHVWKQRAEAKRRADDLKRQAEEAKRKADEESKRRADELKRQADELKRQAEEAKRKADEESKRQAEEAKRRADEEEAKRKADEESKRQADELKRRADEEKARDTISRAITTYRHHKNQSLTEEFETLDVGLGLLQSVKKFKEAIQNDYKDDAGGMAYLGSGGKIIKQQLYENYGSCYEVQGVRPYMEDAVLHYVSDDKNIAIFGVFDGHGGASVARQCADGLGAQLDTALRKQDSDYVKGVATVFSNFEATLKDFNDGSTATLAAYVKDQNALYLINLGDSRTLVMYPRRSARPAGVTYPVKEEHDGVQDKERTVWFKFAHCLGTVDHEPKDEAEVARIKSANGSVDQFSGRIFCKGSPALAVSRAFGDRSYGDHVSKVPNVTKIDLTESFPESVVLFCDGVFETLKDCSLELQNNFIRRLYDVIRSEPGKDIAEHLVKYGFRMGSNDNISVVFVDIPKLRAFLDVTT